MKADATVDNCDRSIYISIAEKMCRRTIPLFPGRRVTGSNRILTHLVGTPTCAPSKIGKTVDNSEQQMLIGANRCKIEKQPLGFLKCRNSKGF